MFLKFVLKPNYFHCFSSMKLLSGQSQRRNSSRVFIFNVFIFNSQRLCYHLDDCRSHITCLNQLKRSSDLLMLFTKFYNQGLVSVAALRILRGRGEEISASFRNPVWKQANCPKSTVIKVRQNENV